MKSAVVLLTFLFLFSSVCFADIAPMGTHSVSTCIKFDNLDKFPNLYLVMHETLGSNNTRDVYIIEQNECLSSGYKFNDFTIYAAKRDYVDSVGVDNIDFENENMQIASTSINPSTTYTSDNIKHITKTYSIIETDENFSLQKTFEYVQREPSLFDIIKCFFVELFGGTC